MPLVKEGYDEGLTGDAELFQHVIAELCKAGLKARVWECGRMVCVCVFKKPQQVGTHDTIVRSPWREWLMLCNPF
eukprot:360889-Chlamydomonas_euryale.AAC.2